MKSQIVKKYREIAEPYERRHKVYRVVISLYVVVFMGLLLFDIRMADRSPRLFLCAVLFLLIPFFCLGFFQQKNDKKLEQYRKLCHDLKEEMEENNLSDEEVACMDQVFAEHECGSCDVKVNQWLYSFREGFLYRSLLVPGKAVELSLFRMTKADSLLIENPQKDDRYYSFYFCRNGKYLYYIEFEEDEFKLYKADFLWMLGQKYPWLQIEET